MPAAANWTVAAALAVFPLLVVLAFMQLSPRRAVLASYVLGWLFLPVVHVELFGFLDYDKGTQVPLVITLAIAVFDGRRLARFRLQPIDLPMLAFCMVPLVSSLGNDLGWYDGISGVVYQIINWGLPYLAGRLYCATDEGLRELARVVVGGGLLYVPFCLWEVRFSPQLHRFVYGYHQHDWLQVFRGGGFRPMVFMDHGLMVGLWMAAATLLAVALWSAGARRMWGLPAGVVVLVLAGTTLACKSLGSIILLAVGTIVLLGSRFLRTSIPVALLVAVPTLYVTARVSGDWAGSELTAYVRDFSTDRADSLAFRLDAEERLRVKALEHPLVGWGGWGRSLVRASDEPGRTALVVTDSLWIIVIGKYGLLGLASLLAVFAMPVFALWRLCKPWRQSEPAAVCAWGLALALTLYAIDNLVNAMPNPAFVVAAGALCGLGRSRTAPAARRLPARPAWALPAGETEAR
jgi:hypothetical protein